MDKTAEDLKVRTKRFCIAILDFVDTLPRTLEVCDDRKMGEATRRPWLLDESGQLCAIFSKACTTARIREHAKR
jgi:hypothetical protein